MRFPTKSLWAVLAVSLWWEVDSCAKDYKSIGVCLHIYLERDYPGIEVNQGNRWDSGHGRHENGPQLLSHCESINETLACFQRIVKDCRHIDHYVDYLLLQDSLAKTHEWLCEKEHLLKRFGALLQSKECIEKVRMESQRCSSPQLPQNIWQKTLRLETDRSICPDLKLQHSCLLQPSELQRCGQQAVDIYNSTMQIFTESWCNEASAVRAYAVIFSLFAFFICRMVVT
ncbi:uncharacterized protein LOC124171605 [Ischnura elegans]|uniref:uncharacterized protein LOC124171605 n=1 Tax=Ischnura elegans TaxID=197161 RepID=UPI001ED89F89|nr:uncharacterized protein LOC124171605 [Ischnura elegans]